MMDHNRLDTAQAAAFNRANTFTQSVQYEEALGAWERVIELRPDDPLGHHARGFVLSQLGRHEEALAALDHATTIDPDQAMSQFLRVAVLARLGRYEEGLKSLEQLPEPFPSDINALANKAAALAVLGRFDAALESLEQAFKAGFYSWTVLAADPNFASMRDDSEYGPRLRRLIKRFQDRPIRGSKAEYRGGDAPDELEDVTPSLEEGGRHSEADVRPAVTFGSAQNELTVTGTKERPEQVDAGEIVEALAVGRSIHLNHARVVGSVSYIGEIRAEFRCKNTRFESLMFTNVTFAGDCSFERAVFGDFFQLLDVHFPKAVSFADTRFEDRMSINKVDFQAEVDFTDAEFSDHASFSDTSFGSKVSFCNAQLLSASFYRARFSSDVDFEKAEFLGKASFAFSVWPGDTSFPDVTFGSEVNFSYARFEGVADFRSAIFLGEATFLGAHFDGPANFMYASFGQETDTSGSAKGNTLTGFYNTTFSESAVFVKSRFYRDAQFTSARFEGEADFSLCTFARSALFPNVTFRKKANFEHAWFDGLAGFPVVDFLDEVNFNTTTFNGPVKFLGSSFRNKSWFTGCLFPERSRVDFSNVTGFAQMLVEWRYDPRFSRERDEDTSPEDKCRRGLKGRLEYDEVFYLALVKNFREMGWFRQSDDAQFTYRSERRRRAGLLQRVFEFLFLELTFGYGTRPFRLLATVVLLCLLFAGFYAGFVSHRGTGSSLLDPSSISLRTINGFTWAFLHSLDVMTPGIALDSLNDTFLTTSPYRFDTNTPWVLWAQRVQQFLGWYLLALFLILFNHLWMR